MGGGIVGFEEVVEEERRERREEMGEIAAAQKKYAVVGGGFPQAQPGKVVVVGYALTSKKVKSFLQPKLESLARYFFFSPVFFWLKFEVPKHGFFSC